MNDVVMITKMLEENIQREKLKLHVLQTRLLLDKLKFKDLTLSKYTFTSKYGKKYDRYNIRVNGLPINKSRPVNNLIQMTISDSLYELTQNKNSKGTTARNLVLAKYKEYVTKKLDEYKIDVK